MWVLVYSKDYSGHKAGDLHLIGRGAFRPSNHKMEILEYVEVPEQVTKYLYADDELCGKLSDLKQYTPEEKEKLPSTAMAALKARGPATNETMPGLLERIQLIERALGLE